MSEATREQTQRERTTCHGHGRERAKPRELKRRSRELAAQAALDRTRDVPEPDYDLPPRIRE
jgi:hypothetical protein